MDGGSPRRTQSDDSVCGGVILLTAVSFIVHSLVRPDEAGYRWAAMNTIQENATESPVNYDQNTNSLFSLLFRKKALGKKVEKCVFYAAF
jgi:hypothetical protein